MKEYFEHNSAKEWWNNDTGKYEKYYEMTDEKKKEVIKYSVDRAYVFNNPSTEENPSWMSPEVNKVMMDVRRQLESYNFDHSDSQSDYYDVNFWSHYDISKEAVEQSLKITRAPEKSLNFVLDKLSAAGIEVVQDKAEFDRILNSAEILQKMQEENKVEDLFVSQNEKNLDSEIDKLTVNDVHLRDEFIEISEKTPFILRECGLNDFPVKMYKQKLARALFLEKEKFGERRTHGHKGEFSEEDVKTVFRNLANPRYVFNSTKNKEIPDDFYVIGVYDQFDNNQNPMMVSFHFNKDKNEIEANWVTAVYGRNRIDIMKQWIDKGYLLYINDLEIEKASAEVGTLYMRVIHNANANGYKIIHKSDFVNNLNLLFYKQNEQTYGFAYEGKIYLNPDIMTSEVAVHEYTHLWDSYTQITNPELWQKGKDIFKNTQFWEVVKADPNYADIADNEDLLLSEVHSQICGKMAEAILTKIAERDGELTKDTVIDWDKEVWDYVANSIDVAKFNKETFLYEDIKEFLAQPMKDLMNGVQITKNLTAKPEQIKIGFVLDKLSAAGIEVVTDKDEFDRILETEDILQKMTNDEIIKNIAKQRDDAIEEKNRIYAKKLKNFKSEVTNSNEIESKIQIQNVNITDNEKEILSVALKETAEEFISVVYSWENYRSIFDKSTIESPIETIKLGSNQFVKLSPGNRNNFMYAIRQTLENPSIILGKETWDNNSETFKPVHLYGKSFVNYNNSEKLVESLIIFKEGNNIAVSLHPNGIDKFVEQIKTTNDIVYLDDEVSRVIGELSITKGDNVVKENENFLSRVRQVSYSSLGQESYPLININYNRDSLLSSEEFISSKGIETGKLEITKDNFDRYFNILNQHDAFKDKRNKIASELFNFHVSSENKDEMKKWLEEQGYTITEKEVTQYMKNDNGLTYGFVHNGKIYLNSELMNSNAAIHEYTHLWDAYTQKTNPELWNKGLELFKDTKYWNEVISDPNYQNIKDDENLVLSEIHSRICGDIAEKVLDRIAELDGEQVKLDAIDWNKEIYFYIREEFELDEKYKSLNFTAMNTTVFLTEFLSTPMKDLMASKNINVSKELSWEELASLFQKQDSSTLGDFKTTKETVQKEESFETEKEYKDEVVLRRLDDILDFHAYNNDGTDVIDASGNTYTDKVLEEKYLILEQISAGIVDGKITSLDNAQILLNDKLLNSELYKEVSKKLKKEMQQEFNFNDPGVNQEVISAAEKERNRIIEPILNGERTGMYKAFKEFEEKGVFDIKGKNVTLAKNGGLTPTGWKQLQTAMEIYRNKKFETFRYIMIDRKTGEIADQLAITSHMPNFCSVSKPNDETLKQVITRAEEKDYLIAVCHNHPSGNTTESSFDRDVTNSLDRSLRNSDGLNRFAGHIILDHNTFNLAVPSEKTPGKCHWKKMDVLNVTEIDPLKEPLSKNPDFKLDDYNIISSSVLISVAQQINDTDNWNDNFVPVVFTNADRGISGVQYYSKNFFENDSNKIRNEFQLTAKEAGAIGAFPVITDNLWNKIPAENRSDFEARMKTHVMNDAFTDVAIDKTTITEKYGIEAGRNYYSLQHEQKDRQVDVDSTWEPSVNSLLFPPEGVGEVDKSNDYKTSPKIKELYLKESKVNIFKDSFIQKEKFVPAIFKNNDKDYIIRVSGNDLINEKYNSINTIYIHMNKNQLQNVLKFHLNNEWNRILDNPASEIKLKIRNPKTLSSNQKELFISKGITDEIKMQKLYADIHKEILFDENNPIVVSKRNFVKQKQIERHNEIQNKKNEFDTDFGY